MFKKMLAVVLAVSMVFALGVPGFASDDNLQNNMQIISQSFNDDGDITREIVIIDDIEYYYEVFEDYVISSAKYPNGEVETNKRYINDDEKIYQTVTISSSNIASSYQIESNNVNQDVQQNVIYIDDFISSTESSNIIQPYAAIHRELSQKMVGKVGQPYENRLLRTMTQNNVDATLREGMEINIRDNWYNTVVAPLSVAEFAAMIMIPQSMIVKIFGSIAVSFGMIVAGLVYRYWNCEASYTRRVWIEGGMYMEDYKTVTYRGIDGDEDSAITDRKPEIDYFVSASHYNDSMGLIESAFSNYF